MNQSDKHTTRSAIVHAVITIAFIAAVIATACFGQDARDYTGKSIVVFSPSYFECEFCESFHRHGQMLKRQYPGLAIVEVKLTEKQAKAMGIKLFPTMWVGESGGTGELVVGFGTDERERIRGGIER